MVSVIPIVVVIIRGEKLTICSTQPVARVPGCPIPPEMQRVKRRIGWVCYLVNCKLRVGAAVWVDVDEQLAGCDESSLAVKLVVSKPIVAIGIAESVPEIQPRTIEGTRVDIVLDQYGRPGCERYTTVYFVNTGFEVFSRDFGNLS